MKETGRNEREEGQTRMEKEDRVQEAKKNEAEDEEIYRSSAKEREIIGKLKERELDSEFGITINSMNFSP